MEKSFKIDDQVVRWISGLYHAITDLKEARIGKGG